MRLLLPDLNKDPNNKLGPFPFKLQLKLDQPGPTLLSFFEEKPIEFKEAKSKVHGELYQYQLWIFLERVNRVLVREDEVNQWEPKEVKGVEMVWYYGVQRYEGKIEVFE